MNTNTILHLLLLIQTTTNAIKEDTLRKFFNDDEKHDLKDMYKILRDVNLFSFLEYEENTFTLMGMGLDINKWDSMVVGFCELNSLPAETGIHMKTLKYNKLLIKDVNQFSLREIGQSLFLRIVVEEAEGGRLNYIFSGTQVTFRLHNKTRDNNRDSIRMDIYERTSLQQYFIRRALENLKRKESTFIIHATN